MSANAYPVFTGSIPALVTPFLPSGEIDYTAFKRLIDWHVQEQSDALVVVGTTGESPTVDFEEHVALIATAVEHAAGRIPIIAGVGGNATKEALHLTRESQKAGAQAGLSVVPYYNKPSQEGLYQHFKQLAEQCELPLLLYNVPGRTGVDLHPETALRLAEVPGIIGIKEATGDIGRLGQIFRHKPDDFQVLSGDDPTAAALILLGGQANISVTANVAPRLMHQMCQAALDGDLQTTRDLNNRLSRLNKVLFVESNPIPVKYALARMGLIELAYRLPLVAPSESSQATIDAALRNAGLID